MSRYISGLEKLQFILSLAFVALMVHWSLTYYCGREQWGILGLTIIMVVLLLNLLITRHKERLFGCRGIVPQSLVIGALILAVVGTGSYVYSQYEDLIYYRLGDPSTGDVIVGIIIILLVLEVTRRAMGLVIPIVALLVIIYIRFGLYFPGMLQHAGMSLPITIGMVCTDIDGLYGLLNQLAVTWVAAFLLFAGLIQGFGGLEYIVAMGRRLLRRFPAGILQIPIVASMAFGTFAGSAAANSAGTGVFTIPLMKRFNVPPKLCAAIEAVASSGGQLMPPVLGTAIFIMMEYLSMSYFSLVVVSLVPALMFYGALLISAFLIARRYVFVATQEVTATSLATTSMEEGEKIRAAEGIPIFVGLGMLLYFLGVLEYTIIKGALYASATFIVARFVYELISHLRGAETPWLSWLGKFIKNALSGIQRTVLMLLSIATLLASMGIIVKGFVVTGLAQKMSFAMVDLSGGHLIILLLLTLVTTTLFGMAVSIVACYIFVIILAAPALGTLGVPLLAAHFAVFYVAIASGMTPPVAPLVGITSGIAGSNYWSSCWEGIKFGFPLYLFPVIFVYRPEIIVGSFGSAALVGLLCFIGVVPLILAIYLPMRGWLRNVALRPLFIGVGLGAIFYEGPVRGILLGLIVLALIAYFLRRRWLERRADNVKAVSL